MTNKENLPNRGDPIEDIKNGVENLTNAMCYSRDLSVKIKKSSGIHFIMYKQSKDSVSIRRFNGGRVYQFHNNLFNQDFDEVIESLKRGMGIETSEHDDGLRQAYVEFGISINWQI